MMEYEGNMKQARVNARRRLVTSKIQNLLLKKIRSVHATVKGQLSKSFEPPEDFDNNYLRLVENTKTAEFLSDDFRKRKLEVMLHRERVKLSLMDKFKSETSFVLRKYSNTLTNLKNAVDSSLLVIGWI